MHQQWSVTELRWRRVLMEAERLHMFWGLTRFECTSSTWSCRTDLSAAGVGKDNNKRIPSGDEDEVEEDGVVRQRQQEVLVVWWRIPLLLGGNLKHQTQDRRRARWRNIIDEHSSNREATKLSCLYSEQDVMKVDAEQGVSWKGWQRNRWQVEMVEVMVVLGGERSERRSEYQSRYWLHAVSCKNQAKKHRPAPSPVTSVCSPSLQLMWLNRPSGPDRKDADAPCGHWETSLWLVVQRSESVNGKTNRKALPAGSTWSTRMAKSMWTCQQM